MTDAEKKYGDIMDKQWGSPEIFAKHPRMTLENRAKQFAPFAALRGHKDRLGEEAGKLIYSGRLELSQEEAAVLSEKLAQVEKGMNITVIYYVAETENAGCYVSLSGKVARMDTVFRTMTVATGEYSAKGEIEQTIPFDDILEIYSR